MCPFGRKCVWKMNLLLPIDFSDNSRNAVAYALAFFAEIPCTFHLLHVLPRVAEDARPVSPTSIGVQQKFEALLKWLNSIKHQPQHQFIVEAKEDHLIEAVRESVFEKNIDLIIMGTKGLTNSKTTTIGKNTGDVMMKVKCPVMAISEKTKFQGHKKILFPTDYNIQYNGKMLEVLHRLIALSKAEVKILEIFNSKEEPSGAQLENRLFLQNSFGSELLPFQTFYASKTTNYRMLFRANRSIDMIVMMAKNLTICQKLLHHPKNDQIPFINQLPLLMLH